MSQLSVSLIAFVPEWVSNWLTPVWILGVGCLAGLILSALIWLVLFALGKVPGLGLLGRIVADVPATVREGALTPLLFVVGPFALFGVVGALVAYTPLELLSSVTRLPAVGEQSLEFKIPPTPKDELGDSDESKEQPIDVRFRTAEIRGLELQADEDLSVFATPFEEVGLARARFDVVGGEEPMRWMRVEQTMVPFPGDEVTTLYVVNHGSEDTTLRVTVRTTPPHPEVAAIPITAVAVAVVFLLYLLQSALLPRISAVALATFKSEIAQPLFAIMLSCGIFALLLFIWIPYNTFGEDIKVLKDAGLTLIMVLCIIQAVWAASTSISEEIEGRTALTVLSKPLGRRSFIIGKFFGISWTVTLMLVVLGAVLLVVVAYKPVYDAREGAQAAASWQICHFEMVRTVPGLVLALMETLVLAALSVAISTRLPQLANFIICFAVYVLGHLTPLLVQTSSEQLEFVRFFAQLIATVVPNLDHFNIQAAVASGKAVPNIYLLYSLVYCFIFSVIALLLALLLFEDRDVA